ncbi:glycosyltransferase family 4 protein [Maribacter sp. BPC-D8]|uniref:glycosyltransferase family 4 protein n=1 Tax=Maribacter sp. BPC-D8 TaxID=3053613 RepID=UPI002B472359|nr:glycosyltransferase family 4 protein [Maribacter sp. BPC-D8]WRI31283.1 glycosyltransferase family 4 protein [Maribacter sp. BPC-D8]
MILHICNDFSLTKVHSNLYKSIDDLNIPQVIFNPVRDTTPIGNNNINFKTNNSRILYSDKLKKTHKFLYRSKISFLFKDLISKIDISKIKISHATTLFSDGGLSYLLKKKYNIPYIVAIRSTDLEVFLKYRPDLIFKAKNILKEAEQIIFISDSLQKKFYQHPLILGDKKFLKSKSKVIYNGIDNFWLDNQEKKKQIVPFKILYVGRLIPRKNLIKLANVVIDLNKSGYNLELNIVGSGGEDEKKIEELALKYKDTFNLLGKVNDKNKLKDIYNENHIFAMPSKGETFGLVYIESLSQGLPLLYLENDGIDNVFNFAVGEKCKIDDYEQIKISLINLIDNYKEYNLDKIDFSLFRWSNIATKYTQLYKKHANN